MPCFYAHQSFGKRVAETLPKNLQKIIKKYPTHFQIGLQGPDFLFFYHPFLKLPTNQLGYRQHRQTPVRFLNAMRNTLQKNTNSALSLYSYLFGYLCHFALDSECHHYIIALCRHSGLRHLIIENAFDNFLQKKERSVATTMPVTPPSPLSESIICTIYNAYLPYHLTKEQIRKSLHGMRLSKIQRVVLCLVPKKYTQKTNHVLLSRFYHAIPLACKLIEDFYRCVSTEKPFPSRFHTTFQDNLTHIP